MQKNAIILASEKSCLFFRNIYYIYYIIKIIDNFFKSDNFSSLNIHFCKQRSCAAKCILDLINNPEYLGECASFHPRYVGQLL